VKLVHLVGFIIKV